MGSNDPKFCAKIEFALKLQALVAIFGQKIQFCANRQFL